MPKPNFGNAASGAISGGAQGFAMGGPIGGAIGAVSGGIGSLFGGAKKKKKPKRMSTLDPQQQSLYNDYINSIRGQGPFNDLYNYDAQGANQNFDKNVGRPAYRNFEENIVPQITGQFRSNNLGTSSYAGEALGRAGRNVQEGLDAQRSNMQFEGQQNAQTSRQNAIQNVLGMQTFAYQRPESQSPSMIDQVLGSVAPQAGQWFADYLSKGSGGGGGLPSKPNPGNGMGRISKTAFMGGN